MTRFDIRSAIHQLCKSSRNLEKITLRSAAPYRQRMPLSKGKHAKSKAKCSRSCINRQAISLRSRKSRVSLPPRQIYPSFKHSWNRLMLRSGRTKSQWVKPKSSLQHSKANQWSSDKRSRLSKESCLRQAMSLVSLKVKSRSSPVTLEQQRSSRI